MSLLPFTFILLLQPEGIMAEEKHLYHRPGQDLLLPCDVMRPDTSCTSIYWFYQRLHPLPTTLVENGNVKRGTVQAARLRVDSSCSLLISNITAEDAGKYVCRPGRNNHLDRIVFLNILTISAPDTDSAGGGPVTLQCSLVTYDPSIFCGEKRLRWVDEAGTLLSDEGVTYSVTQEKCVSALTVNNSHNRTYTCQYVDRNNNVQIESHYTLLFTDHLHGVIVIVVAAVAGMVALLVIIAAVLIICRKRTKLKEAVQISIQPAAESEGHVTYTTVRHVSERASAGKNVREEENVTYSTIKTSAKTDADDPGFVTIPK